MLSKLCWCFSLAAHCGSAVADHIFTNWSWGQWTVSTGEELWCSRRLEGYPVQNLFDGNLKTAWVYSGAWGDSTSADYGPDGKPIFTKMRSIADRYWIHIGSSKALWVDEIRLTSGYNKDSFTFGRNARIRTLEIHNERYPGVFDLSDPIKRVRLYDKMGFQTIKLPARKWDGILLMTTELNPGTDPDVAISELKLYFKGKEVTPRLKEYSIFSPGDECGCGGSQFLIDGQENVIAESSGEGSSIAESETGRYFAGLGTTDDPTKVSRYGFWIYDTKRKRFVANRIWTEDRVPESLFDGFSLLWDEHNRLYQGSSNAPRKEWTLLWTPQTGLTRALR